MKRAIAALVILVSLNAFADSPWSVFESKGKLYVTALGDCNHMSVLLDVPDECSSERLTRNLVYECTIKIGIIQTEMGCPKDQELIPRTTVVDLKKAKLSPEVRTLHVQNGGKTLTLDISK